MIVNFQLSIVLSIYLKLCMTESMIKIVNKIDSFRN